VRALRLVGMIAAALSVIVVAAVLILSLTNTARFVPVLSDSMAPSMPVGALALTMPVPRSDIRVGDVIVFTDPDHPSIRVIHRVEHIYRENQASQFTNWRADQLTASTKGDNNPAIDPWTVTIADSTIWRLVGSAPNVGYPAIWFLTPTFRLWGFGAAGIALITWMLVLVWRRPSPQEARA
jgi:signal peptidase